MHEAESLKRVRLLALFHNKFSFFFLLGNERGVLHTKGGVFGEGSFARFAFTRKVFLLGNERGVVRIEVLVKWIYIFMTCRHLINY